jgi:hypothetical protein
LAAERLEDRREKEEIHLGSRLAARPCAASPRAAGSRSAAKSSRFAVLLAFPSLRQLRNDQ